MTRVAAVDCGTNSIRLLVAETDTAGDATPDGGATAGGAPSTDAPLREVVRRMEVVRLGQGIDLLVPVQGLKGVARARPRPAVPPDDEMVRRIADMLEKQ